MALKKVSKGTPLHIPAEAYNAFVDAAQAHRGQMFTDAAATKATLTPGLVLVKNSSGYDCERFNVLGIDDTICITPTDNLAAFQAGPVLVGKSPYYTTHAGKFVILAEPIASNAIGYTQGSYADWVDGVYTNVPYDCGGGGLSFGVTKWTDPSDWYGGYDDIASLSATGAGTASLPYELAESWATISGSSLHGNAENLLGVQFQDNTFDDAFHWNYIQGSLDPGSPYYDDTIASGKARRAGQVVGLGWFQFAS